MALNFTKISCPTAVCLNSFTLLGLQFSFQFANKMKDAGQWDDFLDKVCEGWVDPKAKTISFLQDPQLTTTLFISLSIVAAVSSVISLMFALRFMWVLYRRARRTGVVASSSFVNLSEIRNTQPRPRHLELDALDDSKLVSPGPPFPRRAPSTRSLYLPPKFPLTEPFVGRTRRTRSSVTDMPLQDLGGITSAGLRDGTTGIVNHNWVPPPPKSPPPGTSYIYFLS